MTDTAMLYGGDTDEGPPQPTRWSQDDWQSFYRQVATAIISNLAIFLTYYALTKYGFRRQPSPPA